MLPNSLMNILCMKNVYFHIGKMQIRSINLPISICLLMYPFYAYVLPNYSMIVDGRYLVTQSSMKSLVLLLKHMVIYLANAKIALWQMGWRGGMLNYSFI